MQAIRVAVIGAGANTRGKHIPLLQEIEGVEIAAVCNRSVESGQRVANQFDIDEVTTDWRSLVERDDIDAVVIGTWPYMHAPMSIAALNAGKHVLVEARMAMNLTEARAMLDASRQTDRVAQIVPSPMMFKPDKALRQHLHDSKTFGEIREIHVRSLSPSSIDPDAPLHWRQRRELSGLNILNMGILYEMLARYFGHARSVSAHVRTWTTQRVDPTTGERKPSDVPETAQIIAEMESGALMTFLVSSVAAFSGSPRVEAYGDKGTLVMDLSHEKILGARLGDDSLDEIEVSEELAGGWRVERDFVESIREGTPVTLTSFEEGVRYMAFTEAVHVSATTGRQITLP